MHRQKIQEQAKKNMLRNKEGKSIHSVEYAEEQEEEYAEEKEDEYAEEK